MPTSRNYTLRNKRVWVAGDRGLVGSALVRRLRRRLRDRQGATRDGGFAPPDQVERWMADAKPQAVFLAAARSAASMPTTRGRPDSSTTT
jgi:GDP-L-fucose synthase